MATSNNSIKSIIKAGMVIDLLAQVEQPMPLAEMARHTGMVKSTLHGIISTLVDIGYVKQDPKTGYYMLGMKLFELGYSITRKLNERVVAYPYMQHIVEQTGETIHLAMLSDGQVLYIDKLESSNSIRIVTDAGVRLPAHCSGLGKTLLSGLSDSDVRMIIKKRGMNPYTEHTITEWPVLQAELQSIREQGYAVDDQEYLIGLKCIAVPIRNYTGEIVCALSLAGPLNRMQGENFDHNLRIMLQVSKDVSEELGYAG